MAKIEQPQPLSKYWCVHCGDSFSSPDTRDSHEKNCKGPKKEAS